MKKLFLVLALLMIGFGSQGAFANTYPACYKGYGVGDPLYNGTNKDKFSVDGWCIDGFGVLTPKTGLTTSSSQPNSQGGMAIPVINVPTVAATWDYLIAQQTGNNIIDMGGAVWGGQTGTGGEYILPASSPGEIFTFSTGSKSEIVIATQNTTDVILYSPSGTGVPTGDAIENSSSNAGDNITLESNAAGTWAIADDNGTWVSKGSFR